MMVQSLTTVLLAAVLGTSGGETTSELCLVGYSSVYVLPIHWTSTQLPPSTTTRWSWDPTVDGTIRTNNLSSAFNGTVECKPVDVLPTLRVGQRATPPTAGGLGMQLLVVSDAGGVAVVDRPSQRVVFCGFVPGAHSATALPDGRIAVVASHLDHGDRVAIFEIEAGLDPRLSLIKTCQRTPSLEATALGAHGVAWVNSTSQLLVVGGSANSGFVYSFALVRSEASTESGREGRLALNLTAKLPIVAKGPHDISPYPLPAGMRFQDGPAFTVTALDGVWLYLAGARKVIAHPAVALAATGEVKSVSALSNGTLVYVVEDRKVNGPAHFRSHTLRFLSPTTSPSRTERAWNVSLPDNWMPVYKSRLVPAVDTLTNGHGPILQRPVFVPNEDGFVCFRGLVLLSAGSRCLIAASEGRAFYNPGTTHCGGATPKALAYKTSTNGGTTWSALAVAASDNLTDPLTPSRLDLGSGVYDANTKLVHVHFGETTAPPGGKTSYKDAPHFVLRGSVNEDTCQIAWQPREDITASDRLSGTPANYRWCGCCGTGFQLPSGRLVVPGYFYQDDVDSEIGHRKGQYNDSVQVAAFLSDDGGKHWFPGSSAPHRPISHTDDHLTLTSEVAIAALANGSLLFNSDSCGLRDRLQALSTNEGTSWGDVSPTNIKDDGVEGGLVAVVVTLEGHRPQEIIVQSTAQGPGYRTDMHLFVSVDGGVSYKDVRSWAGGCGYSEMTVLNDSSVQHNDTSQEGPTIGMFYEGGSATTDYSGQMSFVRIDSAALLRAYWALKTSDEDAPPPSKSGFQQKEFVISMFIEPRATLFNYKLIADANFTTVLQEHAVNNATTRAKSIALCEKLGLNVIAATDGGGIHGPMPPGPVLGVYLRDEPAASEFLGLAHLVAGVRQKHPNWLSFINLYPWYPSGSGAVPHLGVSSYREYLHQFLTIVDPDIFCFDSYPEFGRGLAPNPGSGVVAGGNDTRLNYLINLAEVRNASLYAGKPFWNYFGVGAYFHKGRTHIDATEAEMRWQISMSLTFGARGLLYFYWTQNVHKVTKDGPEWPGIVSGDGDADRPTEHYYQAQRLNAAVKALAATLMSLRSVAAIVLRETDTKWDDEGHPMLRDSACSLRNISRADVVVGCFVRSPPVSGWSRAVMLSNYYTDATQWPTIQLDVNVSKVMELDQRSGLAVPLVDEVAGLPGMQLGLLAGGRRLLLMGDAPMLM